jgi:hypothetical protein
MAQAKKGSSSLAGAVAGLIVRLIRGPIGVTLLLAGLLVGGWNLAWRVVGARVLESSQYTVRLENIEVTPLPDWIHTDVRAEVFRSLGFDGPLSIMDDNLAQRIADAFSLHPWVSKVRRVSKYHPARVKVELDYRRPVCMVEVSGGLLPVDVEGAWLRSEDFSPIEASRYPRLVAIPSLPVGSVGTRWGDSRVVGGAEVAAALASVWSQLQLVRIVPSSRPESGEHYSYEVFTRGGTRIIWGLPPGADVSGSVPAAEKVARLQQYAADFGGLDGPGGPRQLDVRSVRGLQVLSPGK